MSSYWKIYVRDRENLRFLLNILLTNRETELTIRRNDSLLVFVGYSHKEAEIVQYIREELGNKIENVLLSKQWKENVYLFNKPRFIFDSIFPFLVETSSFLMKGDEVHVRVERYSTLNPLRRRYLGQKAGKVLYRVRLFSPILLRAYTNRDGKQCLTFERRNPLILTSYELSSLINGSGDHGLLAI
ncbi:MAG: hypothetical protein AMDU3_IPLC00004G0512 [Thermoplasmatales archaeon I-plasma]|jgi:hypothetical protein|nr:MAG: hypothetical protein AMDU3_IPLC00004G0512 [Thermoplasmatales archaeon I-plasma]